MSCHQFKCTIIFLLGAIAPVFVTGVGTANAEDLQITPDFASPQPLGKLITLSITGAPMDPVGFVDYRLLVQRVGTEPKVMYDWTQKSELLWTPMQEGLYVITALARNQATGSSDRVTRTYDVRSRVTQFPAVSPTSHPLVALFSAPACNIGLRMQVVYRLPGSAESTATDLRACDGELTMNFNVAGMIAETTYEMHATLLNAQDEMVSVGPTLQFTTGIIDETFPLATVEIPPAPGVSLDDKFVLAALIPGGDSVLSHALATNLDGEVVWYYRPVEGASQGGDGMMRLVQGGSVLVFGDPVDGLDRQVLRESDLAGNTLRETTIRQINEGLRAIGHQRMTEAHHEAIRLQNGQTLLLGYVERALEDVQGAGVVDVLGDIVVALDENFQVVWATNFFDILDVSRAAILGEICMDGDPGCPADVVLADQANDWTHSNSITYSPADGNLLISIRHQDMVIKVDYRDGAGTGGLIWRLGKGGDFTLLNPDGSLDPWFSHQHDANYTGDGRVALYDNGNANEACLNNQDDCVSRGQVYQLDEILMTATPVLNADLLNYSPALGSAQILSNGNYHFDSGFFDFDFTSRSDEVAPDGTIVYSLAFGARAYRSFRVSDLYTP